MATVYHMERTLEIYTDCFLLDSVARLMHCRCFVVLQEWGSLEWSVLLTMDRSPHVLPRVQTCIIRTMARHMNHVSLTNAPLAWPVWLSTSHSIVNKHGSVVLHVPNTFLLVSDHALWLCHRRSCNLYEPRGNLQLVVGNVTSINFAAAHGCLPF